MGKYCTILTVSMLLVQNANALSFKTGSEYSFYDENAEEIAKLRCTDLKLQTHIELSQIIKKNVNGEVKVDSVNIQKNKLTIFYAEGLDSLIFEIQTKRAGCELIAR